MRGKEKSDGLTVYLQGITPAYAGKSLGDSCSGLGVWDHPRLCGEKGVFSVNEVREIGSPPPMRGKVP